MAKKNAKKIVESLSENFNIQNIIKNLSQYGVTVSMAIKLHKAYKGNAVPIVQANPYELTNLRMVNFDTADAIAKKMGIDEDSPFRCQAAVLHILHETDGHCYTKENQLVKESLSLLRRRSTVNLEKTDIQSALYYLGKVRKIVLDDGKVYLKSIYDYECIAARKIAELIMTQPIPVPRARIEQEIARYQTKKHRILNLKQQKAIYYFYSHNILVVTGGPGTGKSAIIDAIVYIYRHIFPGRKLALCGTTGRASQYIHKATGMETKTVHRELNWGVKTSVDGKITSDKARKDELNPLGEDLIVDEWSMADIELACSTLRAIPKDGKILLVGDPDQLPSVGRGAVLRDMLNSPDVPRVHLDEVYRQAKNSQITENAYRVKDGKMIHVDPNRNDFVFLERPNAESTQKTILTCVKRLIGNGYHPEDILVLSPIKKGTAGVIALDEAVKAIVNPPRWDKKELTIGDKSFRVGDVIIQNQRNSVKKGLYNGVMGTVKAICSDPKGKVKSNGEGLLCDLWGEEVFLSREDITEFNFTTGNSITTHKSQGGQAKVVISPVLVQHCKINMLTRNTLFTAMTRAEEMLILVGQMKAVELAIQNNTPNLRRTYLAERIHKNVQKIQEKMQKDVANGIYG